MYMNNRQEYGHKYFQPMNENEQKVSCKAIDGIITNLRQANENNSSSSEDGSMPDLQKRTRKDQFSDRDTNSFSDDGIYDDGE